MRNIFLILVVGTLLVSCSSTQVVFDYDKSVDFSKYSKLEYYGWADNSDKILNRFDKERLESSFADEFESRGIDLVSKGEGDLIVSLYIVTEKKVKKSATTTHSGGGFSGYGYGGYYGYGPGYGWGGGHSYTNYHEDEFEEGKIVVSVYDAREKKLIWEAMGTERIDEDPKDRENNIRKTVEQIMKDYPVKKMN